MDRQLGLFPTSLLGSMPRSRKIMEYRRKILSGMVSGEELKNEIIYETKKIVRLQEEYDIDFITNGEFSRDNYVSFIAEKLEGVVMMNMGDMLEYIEDKKSFEQILEILDVPAVSIKNAICNGKVEYRGSLVSDEMKELKEMTERPVKATLPGPYLMTRSMWLPTLSGKFYKNKEELGRDIINVLKMEIDRLAMEKVEIIQIDEPVLTEVVFSEGRTRSFMCAALSEKKNPEEELKFASDLIKEVVDYAKEKSVLISLHVCRGNWSKKEETLLSGSYTPLIPLFEYVKPDILTLEFSTPRAGELSSLLESEIIRKNCILGLGVINPRTEYIESPEEIVERVEEALRWLPKEKIWMNPDCGFATFANRPVNTMEIIREKLASLEKAKIILRRKYE